MYPDQQNQNGGQPPQPQPPYQPAPPPAYGVNSAPQQAQNGQYQVVPPPSVTGHHSGHNPYEFIVNPNTPHKRGLLGGNDFIKKILLLVGGAILLMAVAAIVLSALGPKADSGATLTAITQRQQEIIRVATTGSTQATGSDTKNFATNVELGVSSNQSQILTYLASKGTKLNAKQLALDKNAQTDKLLADATAASTFDSVITQNLASQLTTYQNSLRSAYKQTSNQKTKQVLQSSYNAAALLLEQAKSVATPGFPS
jgi:predicted outer membrane protein